MVLSALQITGLVDPVVKIVAWYVTGNWIEETYDWRQSLCSLIIVISFCICFRGGNNRLILGLLNIGLVVLLYVLVLRDIIPL